MQRAVLVQRRDKLLLSRHNRVLTHKRTIGVLGYFFSRAPGDGGLRDAGWCADGRGGGSN